MTDRIDSRHPATLRDERFGTASELSAEQAIGVFEEQALSVYLALKDSPVPDISAPTTLEDIEWLQDQLDGYSLIANVQVECRPHARAFVYADVGRLRFSVDRSYFDDSRALLVRWRCPDCGKAGDPQLVTAALYLAGKCVAESRRHQALCRGRL